MRPQIVNEGYLIDDNGVVISSYYVDFRNPKDRSPITTVIKGCEKQYAIETCKTVRVSKAEVFRKREQEDLIRDPSEMEISHTEVDSVIVDDPHDRAEARLIDDEKNRAADIIGSGFKGNTKTTKRTRKTNHNFDSGNNGWIFCTSIEPDCQEEMNTWRESLLSEYDHYWYIRRIREFAKALGMMVVEQCGAQGKGGNIRSSFGDLPESHTHHRSQIIFHGPVLYSDDPFNAFTEEFSDVIPVLFPVFVKGLRYKGQKEYRFVIWADREPVEKCIDLNVSLAMLGSLQKRIDQDDPQTDSKNSFPADPSSCNSGRTEDSEDGTDENNQVDSQSSIGIEGLPSVRDLLNDPSIPALPFKFPDGEKPEDLLEKTAVYSALTTLRQLVEKCSLGNRTEAASSAWHIEAYIRRLCSRFEDPIRSIHITCDNFVVVTINFPEGNGSSGIAAIGPLGRGAHEFKYIGGKRVGRIDSPGGYGEGFFKDLENAGLPLRNKL